MTSRSLSSAGADLIAAERKRQIEKEGWSPEHDDGHDQSQLAYAAVGYALPAIARESNGDGGPVYWPWVRDDFRPTPDDRIRELVKAGALIAAEIDRLQRDEERYQASNG